MQTCPAELFGKNERGRQSISVYSENAEEYDHWFDSAFQVIFEAEFSTVEKSLQSVFKESPFNLLEIGIGTGRFALHMKTSFPSANVYGVEPAEGMARLCRSTFAKRAEDLILLEKRAEELDAASFPGVRMDCVLFVTTFGFLEDHSLALSRIKQLLHDDGVVIVAFINGDTPWGKQYLSVTKEDKFYRHGTCILKPGDLIRLFQQEGFQVRESSCFQTLLHGDGSPLNFEALCEEANPALSVLGGHGKGMWSVLTFHKTRPP